MKLVIEKKDAQTVRVGALNVGDVFKYIGPKKSEYYIKTDDYDDDTGDAIAVQIPEGNLQFFDLEMKVTYIKDVQVIIKEES